MAVVNVSLPSGRSCTVSLPTASYGDLKLAAQEALQQQFLSFVVDGAVVDHHWRPYDGADILAIAAEPRMAATGRAFALWTHGGRAVAWGDPLFGGELSEVVQQQLLEVRLIEASRSAFCALRLDGSVVTWGDPAAGGEMGDVQRQLKEAIFVGSVFFSGLNSAEANLDVAAVRVEIQSLRTEVERLRRLQESIPAQPDNEHMAYLEDLHRQVLDLRSTKSEQESAMTTVWILVCGSLCVFMHVGFAMVETGTCRARNASDLLIKNVLSVCVGTLGWWSFGWGFAFGEVQHGFIGTTGFFASDLLRHTSEGIQPVENCDGGVCTARVLQCFFQWAFCTTTTSIVSGAVAERIRSPTFAMYALCMSSFIYPVVVAWTWGGGWLSELLKVGFTDLAGSGVVHLTGGISGLVGAILVRPRAGRFGENAVSFEAHNLPLAVLGTLFLWVGWFGFNAGSLGTLHNGLEASLAAHVAMNTVLAGATGTARTRVVLHGMVLNILIASGVIPLCCAVSSQLNTN
eukprot:s4038_g6.t1